MTDSPDDADLRRALDAWSPLAPPAGFADRVLAARPVAAPIKRTRWYAAVAGALALAAVGALMLHTRSHASRGSLSAHDRTTAQLGDRAVAVVEASAQLRWDIAADGAAEITQSAGDVFYRVDHGGPLVVHTPAGDIHVTGTCFRIEVQMNKPAQIIIASVASAAVATAVVVTVYEGRVDAASHDARTELAAGTRTVLEPNGRTLVASAAPAPSAAIGVEHATREQLVARLADQDRELATLRAGRTTGPHAFPAAGAPATFPMDEPFADGRPWYNPSADTLKAWAKDCRVRFDEPAPGAVEERGITAAELPAYNAAVADVQAQFHTLVRTLYVLATGDTAGVDTLSLDAMKPEIVDKAAPGEAQAIMQRIAQERAGFARAPSVAEIAHASPVEQLYRAQSALGDATQAAIAKVLGPDRAVAIRGDGWNRRFQTIGCPDPK